MLIRHTNKLVVVAALALFGQTAMAQYTIPWHTTDAGGGTSSAGTYSLTGTIGQFDASETVSGGTYDLTGGFWGVAFTFGAACPKPGSGGTCPQCDVNESGLTEGLDIAICTSTANFGLSIAAATEPCCDVNNSGIIEGLDIAICTSSACFGL